MAQSTDTDFPGLEDSRHQEQENAVNLVLKDMQQFLPAVIDPMTLAAMRDYMVTKLSRSQTFDKFFMRNASIQILIKDATERLHKLYNHAHALRTDFSNGNPAGEAVLHTYYGFSEENFYRVLNLNAALEAQRVQCDSEFMDLRTQNQLLEQNLELHQDILQRTANEREQAWRMVHRKDYELAEERERNKGIVERVEAERDRANMTANYLFPQLHDLEKRLQETEKLYKSSKCFVDRPMNTGSQQGHTAAFREMPASAGIDGRSTGANTKPVVDHRKDHESRFAKLFELPERPYVKEGESACNTTKDKVDSQGLSDDSSVENPVGPRKVIPCVPLMPLNPVICASSSKQEHDGASPQSTDNIARE